MGVKNLAGGVLVLGLAVSGCLAGDNECNIGEFRGRPVVISAQDGMRLKDVVDPLTCWRLVAERIWAMAIEERGIQVSDEEVDVAHGSYLASAGFGDEEARQVADVGAAMRKALTAWQAAPDDDDRIYSTFLEPLEVRRETWEAMKQAYGTPEALETMWIPKDEAEARNAGKASTRTALLHLRLAEAIIGRPLVAEGAAWEVYVASLGDFDSAEMEIRKLMFIRHEVGEILNGWMADSIVSGAFSIRLENFREPLMSLAQVNDGRNDEYQ